MCSVRSFFFETFLPIFKEMLGVHMLKLIFYFLKIEFDLNQECITLKRSPMAELKIGNQNTNRRGFFKRKIPNVYILELEIYFLDINRL